MAPPELARDAPIVHIVDPLNISRSQVGGFTRHPAIPPPISRRPRTRAVDSLTASHWPGNARELENAIERAVLVCDGHVIHAHHLSPTLQTAEASGTVMSIALDDAVAAYEKDLLQDALKTTRGNRAKAARLLDTTERIINYKVKQYGIDAKRFKS